MLNPRIPTPPYGFPGCFPYPGLWQSSHCMRYPRPPQGGLSSGCPKRGPSMSGSNPSEISGPSLQQSSGSPKRPCPPILPPPSGSSVAELNPHVSKGERSEFLGGEYSESENDTEEGTDLSEPGPKKRFTPGEEMLRFLSLASSKAEKRSLEKGHGQASHA